MLLRCRRLLLLWRYLIRGTGRILFIVIRCDEDVGEVEAAGSSIKDCLSATSSPKRLQRRRRRARVLKGADTGGSVAMRNGGC